MKFETTIIDKRTINKETLILVMDKRNFQFKAGQYIVVSFPGEKESREYSVYSGENDQNLEILVKTVPAGSFSKRLGNLSIGDKIEVDGPFGFFVMRKDEIETKKHLFVATGTGISPFSSYVNSFPNLKYQLLHGIGVLNEGIEPDNYATDKLIYCVSRELSEHYKGRVSQYLEQNTLDKEAIYHLCGNSAMINDVTDYLEDQGIHPENIRTEAFF